MSTERLTTLILDTLPAEKYSTIKNQVIRDPDLSLNEIESLMETIFINYSERLSVTKRSQESNFKGVDSG